MSYIYKGSMRYNYICADKFGSSAACLSDLNFGVEYLIFLDGMLFTRYSARYDDIQSAAVPFTQKVQEEVKNGLCCPTQLGRKYFVCVNIIKIQKIHYST